MREWLTLSTFDRCRKMLTFIEMVYEDFYEQCHDDNACVTFAHAISDDLSLDHILDAEEDFMRYEMLRRTDKELGKLRCLTTTRIKRAKISKFLKVSPLPSWAACSGTVC